MADTEREASVPETTVSGDVERLRQVLSLLTGQGLLERCASIDVAQGGISISFGLARREFEAPQRGEVTEQQKRKDFELELRRHLPGARIPSF